MESRLIQQMLNMSILSFVLVANIFLFIPLIIYTGNIGEFATPIWSIYRLLAVPAICVFLILILTSGFLGKSSFEKFLVFIGITGILVWIQGNLFVWDYGLLDGSMIDWGNRSWRGWIDLSVWILLLGTGVVYYQALIRPVIYLAGVIFVIQLISIMPVLLEKHNEILQKEAPHISIDALNNMHQFSKDFNIVHLILDSFQTDVFMDIINNESMMEKFNQEFNGFTLYENNIGIFPYTYFSLPAILSGKIYKNDIPKSDFIRDVFSGETILNSAYKAGYEVDIATEALMLDMLTKGNYNNSYLVPSNYHIGEGKFVINEVARILDLTLFRVSPHFLKKYIYNSQRWFIQNAVANEEIWNFFYFSHNAFLYTMTEKMSVTRDKPVYKFFHLMSPHAPIVVNNDCSYAGGELPRNRQTVTDQSRCTLGFVIAYLNKMKELNIYDNSLIIIMADHGGHVTPPHGFRQADVETDLQLNPWVVAMATPLFMVKPGGANHPLHISAAPASLLDTANTISTLLELDVKFPGRSVMELDDSEARERKFYYYEWQRSDYVTEYVRPIQEFSVTGDVYNANYWQTVKEYYPLNGVERN